MLAPPMSLCALLQTLAAETDRDLRDEAATALYAELRSFAGGVIRRRFPGAPDHVVDEAIHKVVFKASLGRSRFRGEDERAARAWCKRIMHRYVLDWLRRNDRAIDLEDAPPKALARAAPDPFLERDVQLLLQRVDEALVHLHRARDLEGVRDNLRCHLETRLMGESIEAQIARWAPTDAPAETPAWRRSRDRVYQYRRRGKVAGCQAVEALLDAGEIDGVEADLLVRIIGCSEAA